MDNTQKALMSKILQSSQYIDKMSRSGAANYIITSAQVADAISEIMTERISGRKKKILGIFDGSK